MKNTYGELIIKMAQNIVKDISRSNATFQRVALGISAKSIIDDANDIIESIRDSISIFEGYQQLDKEAAISIEDEMKILIDEVKRVNFDLIGFKQRVQIPSLSISPKPNKRQLLTVSKTMVNELIRLISTFKTFSFSQSRFPNRIKTIFKNVIQKVIKEIASIRNFIAQIEKWN